MPNLKHKTFPLYQKSVYFTYIEIDFFRALVYNNMIKFYFYPMQGEIVHVI
ncbi:hypothetical protein HMPREF3182_01287 [Megasphaera hutchinsoni]|uniref:Uncharacterized protein n=1 Tax=Megasphaera hutchinsoni TaxID=1588748 RepID=A0A134CEB1_9FIRM|nr:hypothetical protein HMPREF3182_01287 [Megasphaera hutchinsoni]